MPYYEIQITATKSVCVKADNKDDARDTAAMECCSLEWEESETEVIEDYGDGTEPSSAQDIRDYKDGGEYYETEYNEDVPPNS